MPVEMTITEKEDCLDGTVLIQDGHETPDTIIANPMVSAAKPQHLATSNPINEMVCGFYFHGLENAVLLILRTNPQKSHYRKLNGIGGKMHLGETVLQAMVREFEEETGIRTPIEKWQHTISIEGYGWTVHFCRTFGDVIPIDFIHTCNEGVVQFYYIDRLPKCNIMNNLRWLIPMNQGHCGVFTEYKIHVPKETSID